MNQSGISASDRGVAPLRDRREFLRRPRPSGDVENPLASELIEALDVRHDHVVAVVREHVDQERRLRELPIRSPSHVPRSERRNRSDLNDNELRAFPEGNPEPFRELRIRSETRDRRLRDPDAELASVNLRAVNLVAKRRDLGEVLQLDISRERIALSVGVKFPSRKVFVDERKIADESLVSWVSAHRYFIPRIFFRELVDRGKRKDRVAHRRVRLDHDSLGLVGSVLLRELDRIAIDLRESVMRREEFRDLLGDGSRHEPRESNGLLADHLLDRLLLGSVKIYIVTVIHRRLYPELRRRSPPCGRVSRRA